MIKPELESRLVTNLPGSTEQFESAIETGLDVLLSKRRPPRIITIDLGNFDYIGGNGLAVLINARKRAQAAHITMSLIHINNRVREKMTETGLLNLFNI